MDQSENQQIGEAIFQMIGGHGQPWGVGTTAIIIGLGARLINLAYLASDQPLKIPAEQIKELFSYCDQDSLIFKQYLDHHSTLINQIPLQLLNKISHIIEMVKNDGEFIDHNVKIDFQMGLSYLEEAKNQLKKIIQVNMEDQGLQ